MATAGSASFDISAQTDELERLQKDFEALAEEMESLEAIEALAEHARGQMIKRTQEGLDFNDKPFRPYAGSSSSQGRDSKGRFTRSRTIGGGTWAEWRERQGLPTDRVNLTVSGQMLRAIDFDVKSPTLAELYVRPDSGGGGNRAERDDVAEGHQFGGRPWFGVSPKSLKQLEREWVGITLRAMMRRIEDARPIGSEIAVLNDRLELITEPDGPFADYDD